MILDCHHHELNCLAISRDDSESEIRPYAVGDKQSPLVPEDMVDDQWKARSIKD